MREDQTRKHKKLSIAPTRWAMAVSGVMACGATGYMNIQAWRAQASSLTEEWINATISGSLELAGIFGLAFAGYQIHRHRPLRAAMSGAMACLAIYFNTGASLRYYGAQDTIRENAIQHAQSSVVELSSSIEDLELEKASIIEQNDGTVPRKIVIIEAAYSHLNPDTNPLNMSRKNTEIGLREEYNRIQAELSQARSALNLNTVSADDTYTPIVSKDQRLIFIWVLEVFKGCVFFIIGSDNLTRTKLRKLDKDVPQAPEISPEE